LFIATAAGRSEIVGAGGAAAADIAQLTRAAVVSSTRFN